MNRLINSIFTRCNDKIELSRYVNWLLERERIMNYRFPDRTTPRPKGQIAIARDFGLVLNDDGHLTIFDSKGDIRHINTGIRRIQKIAAAFAGYMGLTEYGDVFTSGKTHEFDCYNEIESLIGVADITACEGHTAVIFKEGALRVFDEPGGWEGTPNHDRIVKDWHDIKQLAVGYSNIMGLTKDGHVLYHSEDGHTDRHFYDGVNDAIQIDCYSHYYGTDSSMVLRSDGSVVSDTFEDVETWKDIVQISVGADIAVGLRKDGRLEVADYRGSRLRIKEWQHIVSIECKFFGVIGITKSGEVLSLFV